jgi:hypothetical protein
MQTITIAGKKFKAVGRECTLAHDVWVMNRLRECELDKVQMRRGETADEYAKRFLLHAMSNDGVFELLGGLLIEEHLTAAQWTPELAVRTGEFLSSVTDPADKLTVKRQVTEAVTSFFLAGVSSLKTSQKSSPTAEDRPEIMIAEYSIAESGAE